MYLVWGLSFLKDYKSPCPLYKGGITAIKKGGFEALLFIISL